VGQDVPAKSYITEESNPAEQQRCANHGLQKDTLSRQYSVVSASFMEGLKVRAWRKDFESPAAFVHRDFQDQRPTVVEKDTAENYKLFYYK
jgi:hypothetical protein